MPSVCIDGFNLALPKGSGIATYGRNLLESCNTLGFETSVLYGPAAARTESNTSNLAAIADRPPPRSRIDKAARWRRTLLTRLGKRAFPVQVDDTVTWREGPSETPPVDLFWSSRDLFSLANRAFQKYGTITPVSFDRSRDARAPEIIHWTCPLPLHARGLINVVTIHDLIPLKLPHTTTDDASTYFRMCKQAVTRADHIITVSEKTRQDVIELLDVPETRVTNTYQSVNIESEKDDSDAILDVEKILGLEWKSYFLYFGAVEPKKNIARIIEAYLTSNVERPLIIVGGNGWLNEDENALIEQLHQSSHDRASRVKRFPYMPQHLLMSLIRGSRGVLFPSLYEGFGLPVLEAMSLGAPVLTSNAGSLPEVAGDAAIIVDPYQTTAIRDGIRQLDTDAGLRAELATLGRSQALRFSRSAYQKRLSDLYSRLS